MRRNIVIVLLVGCRGHGGPAVPEGTAGLLGPWQCTAYVAPATRAPPITVTGTGPSLDEAAAAAWVEACAALPPVHPPLPCRAESLREGWTWTREDVDGRVTLQLVSDPEPYQGVAESRTSQDDACVQAYAGACEAAGASPGCERGPAFVDAGRGAVETTP